MPDGLSSAPQPGPADDRRARGLARLAQLADEPGGSEFLARMGVLGDWVVDFAFGDVHTRPGLDARERELIIVAVLTTLGGCEPQLAAHIARCARSRCPGTRSRRLCCRLRPTPVCRGR